MSNTITLNDTQMSLLKEYHAKDVEFQAAKKKVDATDFMDDDYMTVSNDYGRKYHNRMLAAGAFAASVAADFQHGATECTEVANV